MHWAWWYLAVIPAPGRQKKQEDHKVEASLLYTGDCVGQQPHVLSGGIESGYTEQQPLAIENCLAPVTNPLGLRKQYPGIKNNSPCFQSTTREYLQFLSSHLHVFMYIHAPSPTKWIQFLSHGKDEAPHCLVNFSLLGLNLPASLPLFLYRLPPIQNNTKKLHETALILF